MLKNFVQVLHPITKRWVKIDTLHGLIVSHKRTKGPYKNIRKITKIKKLKGK